MTRFLRQFNTGKGRRVLRVRKKGFTVVEILAIITVIAMLATVGLVSINGVQRRAADTQTRQTVIDALKSLQLYYIDQRSYPSNIANTEYAPPLSVAMALYTDAPQVPVYEGLTPAQNAQLFLNSCNGFMPISDGETVYNNACIFNGNNVHVKGTIASNVVIGGPIITLTDFTLSCGAVCDAAQASIVSMFEQQGGTFPIEVPKTGSTLPAPTAVSVVGVASDFCVEGRSAAFADIVYHALPTSLGIVSGPCPADPSLHYP